ncbi:hypothetical protein BH24DEI2_BH24DEI2_12840 [soil metagenome]
MAQIRTQESDFTVDDLFEALEPLAPGVARRRVFEALSGVDYLDLDAIWLGHKDIPQNASASALLRNLALLLGLRKKDAATVLNVSESRISRNDRLDIPMLDRAQGVAEVFAEVAAVLGPQGAQHWLETPNPALQGTPPYQLLGTTYGERRVRNLVTALLNGAVV